ncbi:HTD2 family dehydratase [Sulfitobacter guttiformis]|uniref:3-methylfumaryl-CoA hydratase n=1 Tax=Sulfitobacter guttiformis TaxID=74349 RepID=A0A420DTN1_9RHOB|nr:MaoC family dehydratase N-terminal domain-containing protein [Sulfitobacter guttiformis]KIN71214.1 Itaconyl-CoA hydratase [Sulfitobacter guttiformis KCTC 32187]RKE97684.1 3-methylfumaryl-CoA hydratase [Sulfitobacter guttiformis]
MQSTLDPDILQTWVNKAEMREDVLRAAPANLMEMTLDRDATLKIGDVLPPLWHWLYFLQSAPLSALGRDGHPARGGFLPPVALPRRMWAGGRFGFFHPLHIGVQVQKHSVIKDVALKTGRSGPLCFVTVRHEVQDTDGLAFWEEHDIVYREDPAPDATARLTAPVGNDWQHSETVHPTEVMLFRYSALTFNGHRIHYDRDYARNVEGHAGLVVHGPLIATMLMDLAQRVSDGSMPRSFEFRAASPLFEGAPFSLHARRQGDAVNLSAATSEGRLAMQATARF